jgi:hypothetical protein
MFEHRSAQIRKARRDQPSKLRSEDLAQARGLNVVSVPQISREMAATGHPPKENSSRHDSKLRRPPR